MKNKKYRDENWLYAEYWKNERSAPNMAKECGVTKRVVHYWMRKHGIPLRTVSEAKRGRLHHFWGKKRTWKTKTRRGNGRIVSKDGRVRQWMPDHPNSDCTGYVYEHRLIVEQELGRYLEPIEAVHHKDGDGANNNPENLELFKTNGEHCRFHFKEKRLQPSTG